MGLRITTWNGKDLHIPAKTGLLLIHLLQLMVYGECYTQLALSASNLWSSISHLEDLAKESELGTHLDTSHGGTNVHLR